MKRPILIGLAGLVLAACGGPTITSGKVIGKHDIPAHDYIYMQPFPHTTCILVNKIDDCSTYYTYIPINEHADEEWTVTFGAWVKHKFIKRTVDVSEGAYGRIAMGSRYKLPPNGH